MDEEVRLQELAALRLLDTPQEERFDRLVRIAQRVFDVPTVLVTLIDEDRQFHKAKVGFGPSEIARSHSFCDYTIRDSTPFVVEDPQHHDQFRDNPLVSGGQASGSTRASRCARERVRRWAHCASSTRSDARSRTPS